MPRWERQEPVDPDEVDSAPEYTRIVMSVIPVDGKMSTVGYGVLPEHAKDSPEEFLTKYLDHVVETFIEAGVVEDINWWVDFSPKK